MNRVLLARGGENPLIFLPYVGTSAPEFDADAAGMFRVCGRARCFDMAHAVMEALRSCCAKLRRHRRKGNEARPHHRHRRRREKPSGVPAAGRPSPACRSSCRGKRKPACLGTAIVCRLRQAVCGYAQAAAPLRRYGHPHEPHPTAFLETKYRRFALLYQAGIQAAASEPRCTQQNFKSTPGRADPARPMAKFIANR